MGKMKWWGAMLNCLNIQAMHFQIFWDLTTDEVTLAFRRFCSRRGHPLIKQNDNGKKFIEGENKLKIYLKSLDTQKSDEEVNNNQTKWLFNPPCSPWMSGRMESKVKVTKRALKTIIK